eukprot:GHVT01048665.1.p1 GENE.GHVT01048665.1~~GHVT01048665.1.p1  ORF type:complete len:134 (+),score=9.69 GHVT01048665.1:189-590(+)
MENFPTGKNGPPISIKFKNMHLESYSSADLNSSFSTVPARYPSTRSSGTGDPGNLSDEGVGNNAKTGGPLGTLTRRCTALYLFSFSFKANHAQGESIEYGTPLLPTCKCHTLNNFLALPGKDAKHSLNTRPPY